VPEDRLALGAPADVHAVREDWSWCYVDEVAFVVE
jgi:hypothetical protein